MRAAAIVGAVLLSVPAFADDAAPSEGMMLDDDIIIVGYEAALARSQDLKRNADTSVDSVSSTYLGEFADRTLATSLSRITGVTTTPSLAAVRGLPWIVSLDNGRQRPLLSSPHYQSSRSTLLDPGTALSTVIVSKTRSARMIEGGIGGMIEQRTLHPFDFGGRQLTLHAASGIADSGGVAWAASGIASDRGRVGIGEVGGLVALDWARDRNAHRFAANTALQWYPNDDWLLTLTASSVRSDPRPSDDHVRNSAAALEVRYSPTYKLTVSAAADFGETRARQTTEDDLASLWSVRFDGRYEVVQDTTIALGFRSTSAKTAFRGLTTVRDDSYAGYAEIAFDRLWNDRRIRGNAGLRVVRDETDSGPGAIALPGLTDTCTRCADYQDATTFIGSGGAIPLQPVRRSTTSLLPSLNLSAELIENLQLRLAVSQAIAYPDVGDLKNVIAPQFSFGPTTTRGGRMGNPLLQPMHANAYDLGAEYYYGPMSGLSFGVFHKNLFDIFTTATRPFSLTRNGITERFATTTVVNGGSGHLDGLEIAWQHMYYSLPEPLDHIGTAVNYTFIDGMDDVLPYIDRHSVNASLIYDVCANLSARLAYNWHSSAAQTLDGQIDYTVFDSYRLSLHATDITGASTGRFAERTVWLSLAADF